MRRIVLFLISLALLQATAWAEVKFDAAVIDEMRNAASFTEVHEMLQAVPEAERTADILWRMARAEYDLGRAASSEDARKEAFEKAMAIAAQAIAADPENAGGYKWLAISQGILAQESGTKRKVELSRGVKENILLALELQPEDDFSLLVLGKWNYSVATLGFFSRTVVKMVYGGLPDASLDEAEKLLRQALSIRQRPIHHYNLAKVLDVTDRNKEAVVELEKAILLEPTYPHEQVEIDAAKLMLMELTE